MKDIFLAGIQASGKGIQSQKLLQHFGSSLKYFETGGILRALQSSDNAIGNYLKTLTANGILVKDEVISGLFGVFLETFDTGDRVLADGCFRRMGQTTAIVEEIQKRNRDFIVIELTLPEDEVYKRLENRMMCSACGANFSALLHGDITSCTSCGGPLYRRNDDMDKTAINNRITAYKQDTIPALQWLEQKGYLVKIDGTQSIDKIFQDILAIIS